MSEEGSRTLEDTLAERLARIGLITSIIGLVALAIIAFGNVLIRFLNVAVNLALQLIVNQGPIVAAVLGGISTFATYYGWLRIVRRREKLNAREEAKGQAIDQAGNLLQHVPENPGCLSGCASRLSLGVLGLALVFCLLTYAPQPLNVFGANIPAVTVIVTVPAPTSQPLPTVTPLPTDTPQPMPTATPQPTATSTPIPGDLDVLTPTVDVGFCGPPAFQGKKFSFTNDGGVTIYWTVMMPTGYTLETNDPSTGTLQPFQGDTQNEFFDGVAVNGAKITILWGESPNSESRSGTVTTTCQTIG